MANLEIAGAHKRTQKGSVDYYYGGDNEAWADLASAIAGVPSSIRPGKTVGVYVSGQIAEYWWPDATHVADGDLVVKQTPLPQPLGTTDTPTFASINVNGNINLANNVRVAALDTSSSNQSLFYLDPSNDLQIGDYGVNAVRFHQNIPIFIFGTSGSHSEKYQFDGSLRWENLPTGTTSKMLYYDPATGLITVGSIVQHYQGKYATLTALQTAVPTGSDGDYAIVTGSPNDQEYIWDSDHSAWVLTANIPAGTFAGLGGAPTDNTALAAALAAKVDVVSGYGLISSSDQTKLNGISTGATANSAATLTEAETGTDAAKFIVSSVLAAWWSWIKTQAATISGLWNFTGGLQSGGNTVETQNNKDATGGYAGLTLFKINFKNALNTFTSYFTNNNTASRNYVFQDRDGTILDDTDLSNVNAAIALKDNSTIGFNDQSGTAYTAVLADASKKIRMSNAAANVVTIPLNSSVAFPVGSYFYVSMQGTGRTSIVGAGGVTVQGATTVIDVQYNEALVWKEATDIWKVIGIAPDVSAIDGPLASVKRSSSLNKVLFNNTVNSIGGLGNGILTTSTSQYLTGSDAGLPTGTNITMTFSYTIKTSFTGYLAFFLYGTNSSGVPTSGFAFDVLTGSGSSQFRLVHNSTVIASATPPTVKDGITHNIVLTINGPVIILYIDGVAYSMSTTANYNVVLNGTLSTITGTGSFIGTCGQMLFYNRALSPTSGSGGANEISAIYNGGVGTLNVPQSGLIRQYLFQTPGTGVTAYDTNPVGTQYNFTLTGGAAWAGVGNGLIPVAGTTGSTQYLDQSDGVYAGESSTVDVADILSGTNIRGKNIRHVINSVVTYLNTSAGHLFSKTNTNSTKTSSSCVDIDGNLTIGSTYAGTNAAPTNGAVIQGRILAGTTTDNLADQIQANGNINMITAGNKLKIATGTNASVGTAILVAGTVTVSTTAVTTSSLIFLTYKTAAGTIGRLGTGTITAGTSFVINSLNTDTTVNTSDTSTVNWWIIN